MFTMEFIQQKPGLSYLAGPNIGIIPLTPLEPELCVHCLQGGDYIQSGQHEGEGQQQEGEKGGEMAPAAACPPSISLPMGTHTLPMRRFCMGSCSEGGSRGWRMRSRVVMMMRADGSQCLHHRREGGRGAYGVMHVLPWGWIKRVWFGGRSVYFKSTFLKKKTYTL